MTDYFLSYQIWHWLIVLILLGGAYAMHLARRPSSTSTIREGPVGVGGWLLVLIIALMFVVPALGGSLYYASFRAAESIVQNASPDTRAEYEALKSATWWTFLLVCLLSASAGVGLATWRNMLVVNHAQVILWIIGPIHILVMEIVIPRWAYGFFYSAVDPTLLIASSMMAAAGTAYLSRSTRVRATYAAHAQELGG